MEQLPVTTPTPPPPADPFGDPFASRPGEGSQAVIAKIMHGFYALRRRWWVGLLATVACVVAAGSWVVRQPKVYRASVQVLLELRTLNIYDKVSEVYDLRAEAADTDQFMQTQMRELQSRDMADLVARELGVPKGSLQNVLTVEPDRRALVLHLSVTDRDPVRAAAVVNAYARAYERQSAEKRRGINTQALGHLKSEADKLRRKLESAERAVYEFQKQNELPGANFEDSHRILSANLVSTNGRLSELRARRVRLEAQLEELDEITKTGVLPTTVPVEEAAERWAELHKSYLESRHVVDGLRTRYGERHPKLREAALALGAIEREMRTSLGQLRADVQTRLRALGNEERALARSAGGETRKAVSLRQKEVEYNRLMREVQGDREAYELVARRLRETELTKMLANGYAKVLDEASENHAPISPRVGATLWSALGLGLLLGVLLMFALEVIDDSVRSPQDIEQLAGIPLLGTLPTILRTGKRRGRAAAEVELARAEYISKNPRSSAAEHCHGISTNLYSMFLKKPPRAIAVVGASPEEGKSFVAVGLATTVGSRGRRVLIVDADLRRGRLHSTFGVPRADGIYEVLTADVPLDRAIRRTGLPNVDLLPTGMVPEKINPIRLLELPDFPRMVAELRERYDLVVFDTPPASLVSDVQIIAPLCDGALAVARFARSTRRSVRSLVNQLRKARAEVAGAVINDVDVTSGQYTYFYKSYGYAYRYDYGYGSNEPG